jgi:hypothetical protein
MNIKKRTARQPSEPRPERWKRMLAPFATILLCGSLTSVAVETGAQTRSKDEETYASQRQRPKLVKIKLLACRGSQRIPLLGEFISRVKAGGQYRTAEFIVTRSAHSNLLSHRTVVQLDIQAEFNKVATRADFNHSTNREEISRQELRIDPSVKTVRQQFRPVPINVQAAVEQEIKTMLENDVIELASGPTSWVEPIVPVPKTNRPGEIRACTDKRGSNKAIMLSRHTFPTLDDLAVKPNGAKVISNLGLKSSFLQLTSANRSINFKRSLNCNRSHCSSKKKRQERPTKHTGQDRPIQKSILKDLNDQEQ